MSDFVSGVVKQRGLPLVSVEVEESGWEGETEEEGVGEGKGGWEERKAGKTGGQGRYKLTANHLTKLNKGVLGVAMMGEQGCGKSTLCRALASVMGIVDFADNEIASGFCHTTRGITMSGQSPEGVVLLDMEGQNAGDVGIDLRLQRVGALLARVQVVCLLGTVKKSDIEMLETLIDAVT
jgi:predicted GTPase